MSEDSVSQLWEWRLFDVEVAVAAHLRTNFKVQFSLLERKSLYCRSLNVSSPGVYRVAQPSRTKTNYLPDSKSQLCPLFTLRFLVPRVFL